MAHAESLTVQTKRRPLPQPEPGLTPETLIARAEALRPLLREQQAENDARGYYSDEIHRAFLDGGFYRVVQPRLFGGYEFDYPTFIRVIMALAEGHPSTAWCYTLGTSHGYLIASHWPEEAQADVFGPDGHARVCQRATPAGTITPVDGGYIVDGTFGFCSGAPVSTHMVGSCMLSEGEGPPRAVSFVVRRDQYEVLPDWGGDISLGMQGSGSNSVKIDKVFVPTHHVVSADVMISSLPFNDGTPGTALHGNPMYLGVAGGAFLTEFGAIFTGTARAAIEEFERILQSTHVPRQPGVMRTSDPEGLRALGKAMNLADAAEAVTMRAVEIHMEQVRRWSATGAPITPEDTLQVWGMAQEASELGCRAVDMLFERSGARASLRGQRMQRYFRDIQMYRIHTTAQPPFATMRAQARLGQTP